MTKRDEILRATGEAANVLAEFGVGNRTSFDIVGTVLALGIPLLFRPLNGLWGAAITVDEGHKGVIVTTKLGLQVQRFTLAHELGHLCWDIKSASMSRSDSWAVLVPLLGPDRKLRQTSLLRNCWPPDRLLSLPRNDTAGIALHSWMRRTYISCLSGLESAMRPLAGPWSVTRR